MSTAFNCCTITVRNCGDCKSLDENKENLTAQPKQTGIVKQEEEDGSETITSIKIMPKSLTGEEKIRT